MKSVFKNMIVIIISVIFAVVEFISLSQLLPTLKNIGQYTYETTATIDFIGLPDGTVFVSCYDENNILHEDVSIANRSIKRNLPRYANKEIKIRLNTEDNRAIWLSVYYRQWIVSIAVPLIYLIFVMFFYYKNKKKAA